MPAIMKPMRLACAFQCEPVRSGGLATVTTHALFDFATPRQLMSEQALWPMLAQQMPSGTIFDKGKLKPVGEVIIAGCALSPTDEPVMARRVSARFGPIEKRLAVFGDRVWRRTDRGIELIGTAPFLKMPIALTTAFGGASHKFNRVGKGFQARSIVDAGYDAPLPNVEDADHLIRTVDDAPLPAHFGPIAPNDRGRARYAGTYDRHWLDHVAPVKPDDFNPLYNCDAPEDQRLAGYIGGTETFAISGMSRGEGSVGGKLPDLRPRGFVHRPADDSFTEIAMVCDTVTLLPNVTKAVVTFRGIARCEDRFGDDIGTIIVAVEFAEDAPRPAAYYLDVFRKRSDPENAHKHALSDFQLMPERDLEIVSARREAKLARARSERERARDNQLWGARKAAADRGVPPELIPCLGDGGMGDLPLVAMPTDADFENGELDLGELFDDVERLDAALQERADRERAHMEMLRRMLANSSASHGLPAVVREPLVEDDDLALHTDIAIDQRFASALQQTDQTDIQGAAWEMGLREVEASRLEASLAAAFQSLEARNQDDPAVAEEHFRKACARALGLPEGSLLHDARAAFNGVSLGGIAAPGSSANASSPAISRSPGLAGPEDGASSDGSESADRNATAPNATEKAMQAVLDTSLAQLLPDLRADDDGSVSRTLTERMREVRPHPDGANGDATFGEFFEKQSNEGLAMLEQGEAELMENMRTARQSAPEALFPVVPFTKNVAERFGAFIAQRQAEGHDFKGADLAGASLPGLDFSGRDLAGTFFENADLTGASFAGANLEGTAFAGATLDDADLSGARLTSANLSHASLRRATLVGCDLSDCSLVGADLTDIEARGVTGENLTLIQCVLDRADLTDARLSDVQMLQGHADGIILDGSALTRVSIVDVSLKQPSFKAAVLERVAFVSVTAPWATFANSRLRDVTFAGNMDLVGAHYDAMTAANACWHGVSMAESCFVRATCEACLFNACDMAASDLRLASLKRCQFGRSVLVDSDFFGANLLSAVLMQADLRRASLRGANLYFADLLEANLASCDLTGANLGKTLLEQPAHA